AVHDLVGARPRQVRLPVRGAGRARLRGRGVPGAHRAAGLQAGRLLRARVRVLVAHGTTLGAVPPGRPPTASPAHPEASTRPEATTSVPARNGPRRRLGSPGPTSSCVSRAARAPSA